jgi:phosphoribosylaminoimidazole-succinocarboxamide synthase
VSAVTNAGAKAGPDAGAEAGGGGLRHVYTGKVRDLYQTADGVLLLVASDRISAFDYVLQTEIPDKGKILTRLTEWWFGRLADIVPNQLVSAPIPARFEGRAMACMPLSMVPVECVARGYLTGTGLADYRRSGEVAGKTLPEGLTDGSRLPEPIFDPDSKAPQGQHDENLTRAEVVALVGEKTAADLERITLEVYRRGASVAKERGIIVADTKIELGFDRHGTLRLADEVLTPDSSRFWPAESWQPGHQQPSFDKQYVRDWLTSAESGWDRNGTQPPPPLPSHVVERTRQRYVAAYERITGLRWADQR